MVYGAGKKLQRLAGGMNSTMRVLLAKYMVSGVSGQEESGQLTAAIRCNQLLQELLRQGGRLEVVSQKNQEGKGRTLNEKLIEICYTKDGELQVSFYKDQGWPGTYEAQKQTLLTISGVSIGVGAQQMVRLECEAYIDAYCGVDKTVFEAEWEETAKQILGGILGEVPGMDELNAIGSILDAGAQAADTTAKDSQEIAGLENILGRFRLLYVSADTDGEAGKHTFSLYPGKDTQKLLDRFNAYMQSGEGKEYAGKIKYNELPGGKLTLEYLLKYPGKVSKNWRSWPSNGTRREI